MKQEKNDDFDSWAIEKKHLKPHHWKEQLIPVCFQLYSLESVKVIPTSLSQGLNWMDKEDQ
jgi:hypothetical protein